MVHQNSPAKSSRGDADRSSKTCLVVGGGGFLGRHLVEELLQRKWTVRVFDIRQTFQDPAIEFYGEFQPLIDWLAL